MNKKLIILALLLLGLSACASSKQASLASLDKSAKPSWIASPWESCGIKEVCAVGSGDTQSRANADARSGIMKWFKSNIKSSARFAESADDDGFSSSASVETWEGADGILKGVEIKENFEDAGGRHYSLAGFNKVAAAAAIRLKIGQLDEKMKSLLGDNTKKSIRMLEGYYNAREELNDQYLFLSGVSVPEAVTYAQVLKSRSSKIVKGLSYYVNIRDIHGIDTPRQMTATVKEALTSIGNSVSADAYSSDRHVTGSLEAVKQHLNVSGFVKYQFVLKLDCAEGEKVINSLVTSETYEGRSQQQAFEAALPKLKAYIHEHIYDLIWQ